MATERKTDRDLVLVHMNKMGRDSNKPVGVHKTPQRHHQSGKAKEMELAHKRKEDQIVREIFQKRVEPAPRLHEVHSLIPPTLSFSCLSLSVFLSLSFSLSLSLLCLLSVSLSVFLSLSLSFFFFIFFYCSTLILRLFLSSLTFFFFP